LNAASIRWNTFVVRLWADSTSGQWRGEIVHVQSKESCHFAAWDQAEAFFRRFAEGTERHANTLTREETDEESTENT
jgi:hypothetical protein